MCESEETSPFHLLPTEIFLQICSLLQVRDLVLSLSLVCKRFHEILSDENFWKSLIAKRWNYNYPFQSIDNEDFDWKKASFELEKQYNLWKSKEETIRRMNILPNVHIAAVDAVVFVNKSICVSASRDRSLVIWNPIKSTNKFPSYVQKDAAHEGWIWRIRYARDSLYSCSWDNTVKIWAFDKSDFQLKSTFRCSSPVLSLALMDDVIVAGDYGKNVTGFDPRCGVEPVFKYNAHRRAVLTLGGEMLDECGWFLNDTFCYIFYNLECDSIYNSVIIVAKARRPCCGKSYFGTMGSEVISGSEDKTILIWDTRTRSVKQKIFLGKERFPNCSCMDDNILYVGDSKGCVHVFNTSGGTVKRLKIYNIGHQKPISVIKNGRSYLLTGSHDGTVKVSLPIQPLKVLTSIKTSRGEVGGMDYRGGILAIGTSNYLEFWMPKEYVESDDEIDSNIFEAGFRTQFD